MRRAPIVIVATLAGTAAVLGFNPRTDTSIPVAEAPLPSVAAPATRSGDGIYLGTTVPNPYGSVQVQVAMHAGRIVDVRAVRVPTDDGTSREINRAAVPTLKQQTVTAQSAQVDGVSGATYTSDGYRRSLQAALDQSGRAQQRAGTA